MLATAQQVNGTGTSTGTSTTLTAGVPGSVVGSSIANWVKGTSDLAKDSAAQLQEIIDAVKKAVLEDKINDYGTSFVESTGKFRPATDEEKIKAALLLAS
jgi:hypothetical protein